MIRYATLTNQGGREVNEDSIGVFENGDMQLFVLCDGLGGHGMGADASRLVVDVIGSQFELCDDPVNFLGEAYTTAQGVLMTEQAARHAKQKMKTTCVTLLIDKDKVRIGHIGDSRLYIFRGGRYKKRKKSATTLREVMLHVLWVLNGNAPCMNWKNPWHSNPRPLLCFVLMVCGN